MATTKPVLPLKVGETPYLSDGGEPGAAFDRTMYQDKDTGKFFLQVSEGDWIEVPLDEKGLPLYAPVFPERKSK
jgi:hypothetical protein